MSDTLDVRWSQGLAAGILAFPRCSRCEAWNWYPLPRCGRCQSADFRWVELAPEGKVYSWTRAHFDFIGRVGFAQPLIVALVEISGAPEIRLPVRQALPGDPPRIGDAVDLTVLSIDGHLCWGFELRDRGAQPS